MSQKTDKKQSDNSLIIFLGHSSVTPIHYYRKLHMNIFRRMTTERKMWTRRTIAFYLCDININYHVTYVCKTFLVKNVKILSKYLTARTRDNIRWIQENIVDKICSYVITSRRDFSIVWIPHWSLVFNLFLHEKKNMLSNIQTQIFL